MGARSQSHWPLIGRIAAAIAALLLGITLFGMSLSVQAIAVITGAGVAVVGVALLFGSAQGLHSWVARVSGAALVACGALMALWPDSGAPWLAKVLALALIFHGVLSAIAAVRGDRDHRVASLLTALAGICLGLVAFSWPVLTIALFKLGVGAWLMFTGIRMLVTAWRDHRAARHTARNQSGSGTADTTVPAPGESIDSPSTHHPSLFARWARTTAAALALILSVGAAYGSAQLFAGSPLPQPDSFYTAPDTVPGAPGQLIRTEPLTVGVPPGAQAWKMLYTTTHPDGSPAISSGTILAPVNANGTELPLLTVSHGTTGVIDGCAPSLSATPFADGAGTAMAEMVTAHGWVAVTSDYTGMGTEGTAAYLVGDAEARNVLDASLAARQFDELSLSSDTVVWGHSQGGQGSLWTGQIAAEYAPELTVLGIGAFAPAADLFGLANADKNTAPGKTVSVYIAETWNELFPTLELHQHLTPGSAGPAERISQFCFNGSDALSAIIMGTQVPNQIFPDSLLAGPFGDQLKAQTPTGPFPAPVLVAQGLSDPLVLPPLQQQWVDDRCDAGEVIDYRTFEGLSHVSLVAADSPLTPQLVEWTLDRWSGAAAPTACASQTFPKM
ncbi:MAG: lipase [Microbacteriaceae bacterium]|nr:lipase [Microbacteriaceae bacterium]